MTERKFHKTVIQVTILSEEPVGEVDLNTVAFQIEDGDWSGKLETVSNDEIDGATAARELLEQGSDPGFFMLDEKGEDAE